MGRYPEWDINSHTLSPIPGCLKQSTCIASDLAFKLVPFLQGRCGKIGQNSGKIGTINRTKKHTSFMSFGLCPLRITLTALAEARPGEDGCRSRLSTLAVLRTEELLEALVLHLESTASPLKKQHKFKCNEHNNNAHIMPVHSGLPPRNSQSKVFFM